MIDVHANDAHEAEIDYICIASDLLRRMMSELQATVANNSRLSLAMSTAGHDLRQRLHTLLGTIELLTVAESPARAPDLARSAKAKIVRLANELEELALHAGCDSVPPIPLKHAFDVAPVLLQIHLDWCSEARAKSLGFKITHTVAMVESDPYLLAVIVNNVVAHAVSTPNPGRFALTAIFKVAIWYWRCAIQARNSRCGLASDRGHQQHQLDQRRPRPRASDH